MANAPSFWQVSYVKKRYINRALSIYEAIMLIFSFNSDKVTNFCRHCQQTPFSGDRGR